MKKNQKTAKTEENVDTLLKDEEVVEDLTTLDLVFDIRLKNNDKDLVKVCQNIKFSAILESALISTANSQIEQTFNLLGVKPFLMLVKNKIMDKLEEYRQEEEDNRYRLESDDSQFNTNNKLLVNSDLDDEGLNEDDDSGVNLEVEEENDETDLDVET